MNVAIDQSLSFFFLVLLSSLAGSLHCAGMCGPIHLKLNDLQYSPRLYHLGRGISYVLTGLFAGQLGQLLFSVFLSETYRTSGRLLIGLLFVAIGAFSFFRFKFLTWSFLPFRYLQRLPGSLKLHALGIGLLTPFLPCGWLYGNVLAAAVSGSALTGAAYMFLFWLGTLPVFAGLSFAQATLRRMKYNILGIVYIVFGLSFVAQGLQVGFLTRVFSRDISTAQNLSKSEMTCDLQVSVCRFEEFEIELLPKPIRSGQLFVIRLRDLRIAKSAPIDSVEIKLEGVSMDMGIQRAKLLKVGPDLYERELGLPVCTSQEMRWRVSVTIVSGHQTFYHGFEFTD